MKPTRGTAEPTRPRRQSVSLLLPLLLVVPALALFRFDRAALPWLAAGLAILWAVTLLLYWIDKRAAQAGRARIPEMILHGCEALGGWPAAFLAQRWWRHKSAKRNYQIVFWLIVLCHELLALDLLFDGRISQAL